MKSFLIPSILLAGFSNSSNAMTPENSIKNQFLDNDYNFWNLMDRKLPITLAGHSSHGSHGSHGSHRSSSGGSSTPTPTPTPVVPTPKYKPLLEGNNSTPPVGVLPTVKGNSLQFKRIATRVQMYLYAFGFYTGSISGLEDMDTKAAIVKFQNKQGLKITGRIDNALLKAMNVSTE